MNPPVRRSDLLTAMTFTTFFGMVAISLSEVPSLIPWPGCHLARQRTILT